jgi:hypothetical protein
VLRHSGKIESELTRHLAVHAGDSAKCVARTGPSLSGQVACGRRKVHTAPCFGPRIFTAPCFARALGGGLARQWGAGGATIRERKGERKGDGGN